MKSKETSTRLLAVELLTKIEKQSSYSNLALNKTLEENKLSSKDARLLTNIVYGVIQRKLTLEYWLEPFVENPRKLQLWVKELLLISIYQMVYLDKIPDRAIFNESIEIAKQKGHVGIRKFVTGVLHAIKRQGLRDISKIKDRNKQLSILTSTPMWIIEELIKEVGFDKTKSILNSVNITPKHSVRINLAKIDKENLKMEFEKNDFFVKDSEVTPHALILDGKYIPTSDAFKEGKIIIQDESAMLAVESMKINPNDKILDACAAPGGKTTQIAEQLSSGKVYALDIHEHKVKLIQENAQKLQLDNKIVAKQLDARNSIDEFDVESFDAILVDAPCSGLGLMRRKPEVKYEKKLSDSKNLHQIQLDILEKVAPLVKKEGLLTYSTCTILNIENQKVIDEFLKKHPEFEQRKTATKNKLKQDREMLSLTIYPDDYLSDGFFIATLLKK